MSQNFSARLARWLIRGSTQPSRLPSGLIVGTSALLWIVLTAWGSYLATRAQGGSSALALLDALYGPLTFLAPQTEYRDGMALNGPFLVGRFFGALVPIMTLYWIVLLTAGEGISRWLIKQFASGHLIIVGETAAADGIAKASASAGDVVCLVGGTFDVARRKSLAVAGVIPIMGSASLAQALEMRAAKAKRIVLWHERDADNVADAVALSGMSATVCPVLARIGDPVVRAAYVGSMPGAAPSRMARPVSVEAYVLRTALDGAGLIERTLASGRPRPLVRLTGHSRALEIAIEILLRQCWSIHCEPPRIELEPGNETERAGWGDWLARNGIIAAQNSGVFDPDSRPEIVLVRPDAGSSPHLVLVQRATDQDTLRALPEITLTHARSLDQACVVQAIVRRPRSIPVATMLAPLAAKPIVLEPDLTVAELEAIELDEMAARFHLAYVAGQPQQGPLMEWKALPLSFVEANREAASHLAIKQFDLAHALERGLPRAETLERLAVREHHRWCADRLLSGWRRGPRDDALRQRETLVPWAALSEPARDLDRSQVAMALKVLGCLDFQGVSHTDY